MSGTRGPGPFTAGSILTLDESLMLTQGYPDALSPKQSEPSLSSDSKPHDPVNHPKHYTSHPSGVECIQIVEHMNFNVGNAVKYLWRSGEKGGLEAHLEDLRKAVWYITREIERLTKYPHG